MSPRTTLLSLAVTVALVSAGCVSNAPRPDYRYGEHVRYGYSSPVVVYSPPPPPLRVEVMPPPRSGYVWVPGSWAWEKDHHRWIEGRWQAQPHPRNVMPSAPVPVVIRQEFPVTRLASDGPRREGSLPSMQTRRVAVAETQRDSVTPPVAIESAHGRVREEQNRRQGEPDEKEGRPQRKERRPDREEISRRPYDAR